MKNSQELKTVTIYKETYEHLKSLGIIDESLQHPEPKPKDEMFRCRVTNDYFASLTGEIGKVLTPNSCEVYAGNYACQSSRESAEEFEKLRKQMSIQFEFREVYEQILGLANAIRDTYPVYIPAEKRWVSVTNSTYSPRVKMNINVCKEFCILANLGLIEGLENEL